MQVTCSLSKFSPHPHVGPLPGEKEDLSKAIEAAFTEVVEAAGLQVENWEIQFQEKTLLMSPSVLSPQSAQGEIDGTASLPEAEEQLQEKAQKPFWRAFLSETEEAFLPQTEETSVSKIKETTLAGEVTFFSKTKKSFFLKTEETFFSGIEKIASSTTEQSFSETHETTFSKTAQSFPPEMKKTTTSGIEKASSVAEPSLVQEPQAEEQLAVFEV